MKRGLDAATMQQRALWSSVIMVLFQIFGSLGTSGKLYTGICSSSAWKPSQSAVTTHQTIVP